MKKYKSVAIWPKGKFDYCNNRTEDAHDTYGQAQAVCNMLMATGNAMGFPEKAFVEPIIDDLEELNGSTN